MSARRGVAACAAATVLLGGCNLGSGLYGVALPGGADLGAHPYTVTARFTDALDLVPQAGVRVDNVPVGRVDSVRLEPNGRVADVRMTVNGSTVLPADATAEIQQTTLLGEKYVALAAPTATPATGRLRDGAVIGLARTASGVEVEQVFGALSLLLNGGGVAQVDTITTELNRFAHGNTPAIRMLLTSSRRIVAALDLHKRAITDALGALATLSGVLRRNDTAIARVLRSLAPGLAVVAGQSRQLRRALVAMDHLSTVTVSTLQASQDDLLADLDALAPVLHDLAAAGSALPRSLQVLVTYPFPDAVTAGVRGDYLNAFVTTALNTPGGRTVRVVQVARGRTASTRGAASGPPTLLPHTSAAAPGLPGTLTLAPAGH